MPTLARQTNALMLVCLVLSVVILHADAACCTGLPGRARVQTFNRKLLQTGDVGSGNTLRTEVTTAQMIEGAVQTGADPNATGRAANTGSNLVFTNSQSDQGVFDVAQSSAVGRGTGTNTGNANVDRTNVDIVSESNDATTGNVVGDDNVNPTSAGKVGGSGKRK